MKRQSSLFDTTVFPKGFVYRPNFLTKEEEEVLLSYFDDLPFEHPYIESYAAKRRIINFGWGYDFKKERIVKGPPLPPLLRPLKHKIAKWLHIPKSHVIEALINEYTKGSAIGWHRDNEPFEHVVSISLLGKAELRLRPIGSRVKGRRKAKDITSIILEPRSAYMLKDDARWMYQHSIPKVDTLRYSITFRTVPKR